MPDQHPSGEVLIATRRSPGRPLNVAFKHLHRVGVHITLWLISWARPPLLLSKPLRMGRLANEARLVTQRVRSLNSIDQISKELVLRPIRRHHSQLESMFLNILLLSTFLALPVGALIGVMTSLSPRIIDWHLSTQTPLGVAFLLEFMSLLGMLALVRGIRPYPRSSYRKFLRVSATISVCLIALFVAFLNAPRSMVSFPLYSSFASAILFASVVFAFFPFTLLTMSLISTSAHDVWATSTYPDSFAVDILLSLLSRLERHPTRWAHIAFRRKLVSDLEDLARCIEHSMPRRLYSRDASTDLWLRSTAVQIAAAFRARKRFIFAAGNGSREHLIQFLATSLVAAAKGEWGNLERDNPESVSRPQWLLSHVGFGVRALTLAFGPLFGLWLLQQTLLALPAPYSHYATLALASWAVLYLAFALDPLLNVKIEGFRGIASIFFAPSKQSKD